ncbi:chromatin target of PRMT1b [Hemibagrus wyckioides]|uniref:chromatin target of PRMT1b n=1 Tax=Hemibagrus wyckioides TaxID=337641 RepID=UPI00266DC744|nr:chromatin target of PRMT1b [Hemibagrus wyckioides]XP_058252661.1 chromatin target of PRMT1b [Hemibagrus wyckioides]XP_058252671.1 chromatin target of PRMT1b [Hemibagrus wyckioides]
MSSPCSQILLKSTTSISLDERFTMMLQSQQVPLTDIKDTIPQQLTASVKNQRLAQQMANRPSVLAALQNKLSVKQHQFKGNVKARLGRPMMRGGLREMPRSWGRPRGRGLLLRGALSHRFTNGSLIQQQHGPYINREGLARSRGLRGAIRGKAGRGMLFVGRGSAGRRPDFRPLPTREELDAQLDEYMSMTKSQLDAQLDEYMAEVDPEDLPC